MMGNTVLVDYGIQTEDSDIRAHVSVIARRVYVFKTPEGRKAAEASHRIGRAYQHGVLTARGKLVTPDTINGCLVVEIPDDIFEKARFVVTDSEPTKGNKAVFVVKEMLKRGLVPVDTVHQECLDKEKQIRGVDIEITAAVKLQVKCDWFAGHKALGGTGNLFLQFQECNPNGLH